MANARRGDRVLGPYRRRDKWRAVIVREDGSRRHRDFETEAKARGYIKATATQLATTAGITIGQATEEYERHLAAKGDRPRSVVTTLIVVRRMFRDPDLLVSTLRTAEDGQALYKEVRTREDPKTGELLYAVDTHRGTLNECKRFLRWCVEQKWLRVNVLADVKGFGRRITGRDKPQLRVDEARAWTTAAMDAARAGDEGAVAALVSELLGMRATEIVERAVRDLDDRGRLLWIPDSKTAAGKRTLEVPLPLQPFLRRLAHGKTSSEFLFGPGDEPRNRNWVRRCVHRICKLAGVPRVSAHAMRRLHSTLAVEAGATGHLVVKQLGHESFATTRQSYIRRGTEQALERGRVIDLLEIDDRHPAQRATEQMSDNVSLTISTKVNRK